MANYIVIDKDGYGSTNVELSEDEFNKLSEDDQKLHKENHSESTDDYLYRKFDVDQNLWIDDIDKKIELNQARYQARLDAEQLAVENQVIPIPTKEELDTMFTNSKQFKLAHVNTLLKQKLESGVLFNGKLVDTSQFSLILLNGAFALAINNKWPDGQMFKLDGKLQVVTNQDILDIFTIVQTFIIDQYNQEHLLVAKIQEISNQSELDALDISF